MTDDNGVGHQQLPSLLMVVVVVELAASTNMKLPIRHEPLTGTNQISGVKFNPGGKKHPANPVYPVAPRVDCCRA